MSELPKSTLGRTGLEVTRLGYGAMELRGTDHFPRLSASEASAILNAVLDNGINYIDTSPDYGYSEELIGRHIAHRRDEFILASKCGCPVEPPDVAHSNRKPHSFTRENIRAGVEQSEALDALWGRGHDGVRHVAAHRQAGQREALGGCGKQAGRHAFHGVVARDVGVVAAG